MNVECGVWNYELVGFADYELFNEELNPFDPYYPDVPCLINLKGASQLTFPSDVELCFSNYSS